MIFHLRPINEYDLQQIKHINDLVQRVPWSLNEILTEFDQNNPFSVTACDDGGRVIGYMFLRNAGFSFEIMTLGVLPACQRCGVARKMIEALIREIPPKSEIFLEVSDQNTPALNLYLGFNFEKQGIRQHYYKDGSNAVCMKLNLAKP